MTSDVTRQSRHIAALPRPGHVVVVGAGVVGMSTALFLARAGVGVTVIERTSVAAGASWGNAGFLTPALTTPLPQPSILRTGVRALVSPRSPLYVPLRFDVTLWRFLLSFARNCTAARWDASMQAYAPLAQRSLAAFDALGDEDVASAIRHDDVILAACGDVAARDHVVDELDTVRRAGIDVDFEVLDRAAIDRIAPEVGAAISSGVALHGQRSINPPHFMAQLDKAVSAAGVEVRTGFGVEVIRDDREMVTIGLEDGEEVRADRVVVATGAELGRLVRTFGVRRIVQAGRGYSFSVKAAGAPQIPTWFPSHKIVATPLGEGRTRIAGMMEFRRHGSPLDPRRIEAITDAARVVLPALDLDDRQDEWVGSRPVTTDGRPLIGPTSSPRVIAAGGHGMWGVVLGPLTGQLVANMLVEGTVDADLEAFDPLR